MSSVSVQDLLRNFNFFTVGSDLGHDTTTQQVIEAERKAKVFFEENGLLPTRNDLAYSLL